MTAPAHSRPQLDLDALREEIQVFPVILENAPAGSSLAGALDSTACDWLAPDELARARRFSAPRAQTAFVQCRALLRCLLADYLQQPAASLDFAYSDFGKPSLAAHPELCFNISHSGPVALLAFTLGASLGVDIERIRHMPSALALADRFFSQAESSALRSLPADESDGSFLSCWTRKEAAIKALGVSLDGQLASFSVPLEPMPHPLSIAIAGSVLTLHSLALAPHAVGALAHAGPPRTLRIEPFQSTASFLQ
jgi:4'-phosphopantetheinyl transferase